MQYRLIGSGGTGTHLLPALVHYLAVYHQDDWFSLMVVDGDEVESKNLSRQLFDSGHVTLNKAVAAISVLREDYPSIIAVPEYLNKNNIEDIIIEGCTVIIAVDNYPIRALIEERCKTLDDVTVINGGNEIDTGSCQIWIRKGGVDITPPISFLHPEILAPGLSRAEMSCAQIANLNGGEQLIVTNMASAMWILMALVKIHNQQLDWTELHFDLSKGKMEVDDWREEYAQS